MSKIDGASREAFLAQAEELNALMVQIIKANKLPLWELILNKAKSRLNLGKGSKGS
jgi:hypothetical protein